MVLCLSCQHSNVSGTLFCDDCGTALIADTQATSRGHEHEHGRVQHVQTSSARQTGDGFTVTPVEQESPRLQAANLRQSSSSGFSYADDIALSAQAMATAPAPTPLRGSGTLTATPPSSSAPRPYLMAESGRRLDIPEKDVVIVGREDMRSGIRPDVDLTLDGASAAGVSRRHCRLLRHADGWQLEDLMSTNFTILNGKALAAHTPAPVKNGDDVRLGKLRLKFYVN